MKLFNLFLRTKKSILFKDTALYTVLNFIEKVIPFIILPIITRLLTKEDVGYYVFYQALVMILIPMMTLKVDSSIFLSYFKISKEEFKIYFSNGLLLLFIVYLIIFLTSSFLSKQISTLLNFPVFWLNVVFLMIIFECLTLIRRNLWIVKRDIKHYGVFSVGLILFKNGIGLILVYYTNIGWKGLILGHLITYFLFGIYAMLSFYNEDLLHFKVNKNYLRDTFKVGFPIALHKMGLWLSNNLNRTIINSLLGAAATGSYGIGATFGVIVTVFNGSFNKAFSPYLFRKLKNINEITKLKLVKITYIAYFALIVFSIILFLIGYFGIGLIFGEEYMNSREFILPLVLAAMFKGYYTLHVNYIFFTKKTLKITQITFTTGIVNVFLAYFMILKYELVGAAYSMLIISFTQYVLSFYFANKLIPMPWGFFIKKAQNN